MYFTIVTLILAFCILPFVQKAIKESRRTSDIVSAKRVAEVVDEIEYPIKLRNFQKITIYLINITNKETKYIDKIVAV